MDKLIEQLKRHEGFRSNYYQCTANKKTIGYGRNIDDNPFTEDEIILLCRTKFNVKPISKNEAEHLLINDVNLIKEKLRNRTYIDFESMNEARHAVCVNMVFNLGISGFCKFKNMISEINTGNYTRAAVEMLNSKWAKQVGARSYELAAQMKTGEWQ